MRQIIVWSLFLYLSLLAPNGQQAQFGVNITAPRAGQALQGLVEIHGSSAVEGFSAYRLDFSFADDPTATWFMITQSEQPVEDGTLGEWDTSALTDGSYTLRLTVARQGADPLVVQIEGLRVRNYSPIETNTPAPTPLTAETLAADQLPSATPTPTMPPEITTPPTNPASLDDQQITQALVCGIIAGLLSLGALGLYSASRDRARQ